MTKQQALVGLAGSFIVMGIARQIAVRSGAQLGLAPLEVSALGVVFAVGLAQLKPAR